MKPWDGLTDLEKREAIARRLGWQNAFASIGGVRIGYPPTPAKTLQDTVVPDWPTNDGLAFAEVWPKILQTATHDICALKLHSDPSSGNSSPSVEDEYCRCVFVGPTWADAICRAAYELLPEQKA